MYKKKYECIIPKSRKGANAWEYGYYREKDMLTIEIPKYEIDQMFVGKNTVYITKVSSMSCIGSLDY